MSLPSGGFSVAPNVGSTSNGSLFSIGPNSSLGGNVLGASTSPSTTQSTTNNYQTGGWYNGQQWDGSKLGPVGQIIVGNNQSQGNQQNQSQGNQQSIQDLISSAYQPAIDNLNQYQSTLQTNADATGKLIDSTLSSGQDRINQEKQNDLTDLSNQQDQYGKQYQSALSDSARYLNALQQQAMSRFGGGQGLGGAIGELSNQAYLQNQGDLQQQNLQFMQAMSQQKSQLGTYIGGKLSDLQNWHDQAIISNNQQLATDLANIGQQRGVVEANKAQSQIDALNQAMSRAQQISDTANSFKQNLAAWSVQQAQAASGTAWTPAQIANQYNQQMAQPMTTFAQNTTSAAPTSALLSAARGQNGNDPFKQLGLA